MLYFVAWVVFLLLCIIALPVASVMDKRKVHAGLSSAGETGFAESEFQDDFAGDEQAEPAEVQDDGFGGEQAFPAEEMADMGEPVQDDFSAFDEEFK
jgi:hypothetical protein